MEATAEKSGVIVDGGAPDTYSIGGYLSGDGGANSSWSQMNAAETYYYFATHHPYIGAAVTLIAEAIAGDGYDIVAPGTDLDQDEVNADPRVVGLRTLFANVNSSQSLMELIEEISMDYDITGKAYIRRLRYPSKQVCGYERIDPRTMAAKLSSDGKKIAGFTHRVRLPSGLMQTTPIDASDIIFIKRPGGADLLGGASLLDQLDMTLAVDFGARRHNAAYFRNGAKAGLVLINESLTKSQKDDSEASLKAHNAGSDQAYKPLVLAGKWTVHPPTTTDDEEQGKTLDRAREEVCATFHVPESKLRTTEGALGGNGKEQDDQTFHEECVGPRARRIFAILTREILATDFGITDLALVPRSKYQLRFSNLEYAVQMLQAGASINEARDAVGLPKKKAQQNVDLDAPYVAATVGQAQNKPDPLEMAKAKAAAMPPPHGAPGAPAQLEPEPPAKKAGARKSGRFQTLRRSIGA